MGQMLLIGLIVVAVGSAGVSLMLFGQRTNPLPDTTEATIPVGSGSAAAGRGRRSSAATARPAASGTTPPAPVKVRWYQRVRSLGLLLLITVGLGTAFGAVFGAIILVASVLLG